MDLGLAKEITAQCVANCMVYVLGGEFKPLPDCSLGEMLEANRLVTENNAKERESATPGPDGVTSYSIQVAVDPRLLALSYAFERYGRNPIDMLGALGIEAKPTESDENYDDDDGHEAEETDDGERAAACG